MNVSLKNQEGSGSSQDPDMRHPKIQAILRQNARLRCELDLIEEIVEAEDPGSCGDGLIEYWGPLHDKIMNLKKNQSRD